MCETLCENSGNRCRRFREDICGGFFCAVRAGDWVDPACGLVFYSPVFYSPVFYCLVFYSLVFYSLAFYSPVFYNSVFYSPAFYSLVFLTL